VGRGDKVGPKMESRYCGQGSWRAPASRPTEDAIEWSQSQSKPHGKENKLDREKGEGGGRGETECTIHGKSIKLPTQVTDEGGSNGGKLKVKNNAC